MRFKLAPITAVVLLAVSGSASAAISYNSATNPNGPAEIFVNIMAIGSEVAGGGISFTVDLGAPINLSTSGGTYATDPTLQNSGPTSDWSKVGTKLQWSLANDNEWLKFKGTSGVSTSNAVFDVKAINGITGGTAIYSALTTLGSGDFTQEINQTLNNYKQVAIGGLVDGVNGLPGMAATNGSTTAVNGDGAAFYPNGSGDSWKGFAQYVSTGSVNSALPFYLLSRTVPGTASATATLAQYGVAANPGLWTVNFAGNYIQYEVAAIPEPGTWAMLTAGLLAVAGVARRRVL